MLSNKKLKAIAVLRSAKFYIFCLLVVFVAISKAVIEITFSIIFFLWFIENILVNKGKLKEYFPKTRLNFPIAVMMAVLFLSVFNSVVPELSLKKFFSKWVQYVMLFFFTVDTIDSKKKLKTVLWFLSFSLAFILIDASWQFIAGSDFIYNRTLEGLWMRAHFNGLNPFGGFLILVSPVVITFLYSVDLSNLNERVAFRRLIKVFRGAALILVVFCILLSCSVVSWVALTLSLVCVFFCYSRKKALIFSPFIALPIIIIVFLPFFNGRVFQAIHSTFISGGGRIAIWKQYFQEVLKNPFLGKGINTTSVQIAENYSQLPLVIKANPHNFYLLMAVETGIFGLAAFFWFIWRLLFLLFSAKRSLIWYGLFLGIVSFLIVNLADNIWDERIMSLFWIIIGFVAVYKNLFPLSPKAGESVS